MSRPPSQKTVVSHLFADSQLPIYLLDASRRIVYANQALADWVELEPEFLLAKKCSFTATAGREMEHIFNQLCPPPQAWYGAIKDHLLVIERGGQLKRRRACCFPLADAPGTSPMLIVLEQQDAGDPRKDPLLADSLHHQLAELRRQHQAHYGVDRLIGQSPAMRQVRNQIAVAASCPACRVVVTGNPGTGRETVARTIHQQRHQGITSPMIRLSCSLLDTQLLGTTIEALLNQPADDRVGPPALLLLDVDKLEAPAQTALSELFATAARDLATIATSRIRLSDLVALGEFREDLGCHLVNLEISLPSLRERLEDVPLIAQWLVEKLNAAGNVQIGGLTVEAMEMLIEYEWPGEVAELLAHIQAAFQAAGGPLIEASDLPKRIQLAANAAAVVPVDSESIVLDEFLAEVETELIRRSLGQAKGNKAQAARNLGISRAKILRRIDQLRIQ